MLFYYLDASFMIMRGFVPSPTPTRFSIAWNTLLVKLYMVCIIYFLVVYNLIKREKKDFFVLLLLMILYNLKIIESNLI